MRGGYDASSDPGRIGCIPKAGIQARVSLRFRRNAAAGATTNALTQWFLTLYRNAGLHGASSHSRRRTFGTMTARKFSGSGRSLVEVQRLLGHAWLDTTAAYVESSENLADLVNAL